MSIYAYAGGLSRAMPQYATAKGRGIARFSFDDESGRLTPLGETGGIDDVAWLLPDAPHRRLYATREVVGANQSAISTYSVDPADGDLRLLGTQQTLGGEVCHASLSKDGRFLFVANYNGVPTEGWPQNAVTVFPIAADGSLMPAVSSITHEGRGPNPDRQTTPHAHCVLPTPDGRHVYVVDLGMDRLVAYRLEDDGMLTAEPARDFAVPPGLGPRHVVFHPNGRWIFLVNELIASILSLAIDPATGAVTQRFVFNIPILIGNLIQPAGIALTADSRFLFASLRVSNEILGLAIDPATGALTETGRWPSGGTTPRDFAISPSGRHLIVANQDSDMIVVFAIDQQSGTLSAPLQRQPTGTPMSLKLVAFPAP